MSVLPEGRVEVVRLPVVVAEVEHPPAALGDPDRAPVVRRQHGHLHVAQLVVALRGAPRHLANIKIQDQFEDYFGMSLELKLIQNQYPIHTSSVNKTC